MKKTVNKQLSPHFTLREMIASDTARAHGIDNTPNAEHIANLKRLCIEILEPVRRHFARPISPSSGYRSPALNKTVGSKATSQHTRGEAVDFEIAGISNREVAMWIEENLSFDQLILENHDFSDPNSGWIHVSFRDGLNRQQALVYNGRTRGFIDFNLMRDIHDRQTA